MSHVRSFWPTAAHPLSLLSNARITHYERTGHYGPAAQARRLEIDRIKAAAPKTRHVKPTLSLDLNSLV